MRLDSNQFLSITGLNQKSFNYFISMLIICEAGNLTGQFLYHSVFLFLSLSVFFLSWWIRTNWHFNKATGSPGITHLPITLLHVAFHPGRWKHCQAPYQEQQSKLKFHSVVPNQLWGRHVNKPTQTKQMRRTRATEGSFLDSCIIKLKSL